MTIDEVLTLVHEAAPKMRGSVTWADVLLAFEAWICARVARAESHRLFMEGGCRPRLVWPQEELS